MSRQEPELIILMGIQASGKSTFYHQRFAKTHLRINLDMLWTRPKEKKLFESCMQMRQQAVIDNTNLLKSNRERYIPTAKKHNMRVIGYYFQPNLDDSLSRNEERDEIIRVPKGALISAYNKIEAPLYEEGFDEIYIVASHNGNFIVEEYKEDENQRIDFPQAKERIFYFDLNNIKYKGFLCCSLSVCAKDKNVNISFEFSDETMVIYAVGESDTILDDFVRHVLAKFSESEKKLSNIIQTKEFIVKEDDRDKILFEAKAFPNLVVDFKEKSRWFGLKVKTLLFLGGAEDELYEFEKRINKYLIE